MNRLFQYLSLLIGVILLSGSPSWAVDEKKEDKKVDKKSDKKDEKSDEKKDEKKDDKKEEKKTKSTPEKAPDWSKFAASGELTGIIAEASDDGITLRIPKRVPRGKDIDQKLKYAEQSLVRWKKLPPKLNENGKKAGSYSVAEMEKFKSPQNVPGYAADKSDLVPGKIVELQLVRPKSVPASKVTPEDIVIKYIFILGETVPPKIEKN